MQNICIIDVCLCAAGSGWGLGGRVRQGATLSTAQCWALGRPAWGWLSILLDQKQLSARWVNSSTPCWVSVREGWASVALLSSSCSPEIGPFSARKHTRPNLVEGKLHWADKVLPRVNFEPLHLLTGFLLRLFGQLVVVWGVKRQVPCCVTVQFIGVKV